MSKSNDTISRQDAIRWVKTECNPYGKPTLDYESGKKVIAHLEQMPSAQPEILACGEGELNVPGTNVGDMISRQAALQAMDTWDKFGCGPDGKLVRYDDDNHYAPYVHYDDMVHVIKHLPSTQPERKKGKWIEVNDAYNRISGRCSACGWEAHMYEDDVVGMPFCPSCGADMREEVQDGQN